MRKLLILLTCATVLFSCGKKEEGGQRPTKPKYYLYSEPILTFGVSKETIKQTEKRMLMEEEVNGLLYDATKYGVIYLFEDDKLKSSSVILPLDTDIYILEKVLSKDFDYLGNDEGYFFWDSESRYLVAFFYKTDFGIFVTYVSRSEFMAPEKTANILRAPLAEDMVVKNVKNAIDQLLKQ